MSTTALELSGITKRFGSFTANSDISLSIRKGSIHAIAGENGAGKSTLSNIIYGLVQPDAGTLYVDGNPCRFSSPREAIGAGIGMVHQHFMLSGTLSVMENILLGDERQGLLWPCRRSKARQDITDIAERHGMQLDPDAMIENLSVGEEQRVEILKLLYRNAQLLLLDEPTAVLAPAETRKLFSSLRSLRDEGRTIILITHKLDEVLDLADNVSIMRKGEITATLPCSETSKQELARLMVGRNVVLQAENPPHTPGAPLLEIDELSMQTGNGRPRIEKLSMTIRKGEIYGLAGVEGNGQSELLQLLWGMLPDNARTTGSARLDGKELTGLRPVDIAALGVSCVPEDRHRHAAIGQFSIEDNMLLGRHREKTFVRGSGFDSRSREQLSRDITTHYDLRTGNGTNQAFESLSGGNQQKIIAGRELSRPALRLLLLGQPTRGVDIGAIELIHKKILEARQAGVAILLISTELEEIITLSTRIGCIYKGKIRHEFSPEEVQEGRTAPGTFSESIGMHIT